MKKDNGNSNKIIDFHFHAENELKSQKQADKYLENWIAEMPLVNGVTFYVTAPVLVN